MRKLENRFLKPAKPGLIVRDPRTRKPLADDGEWKPWDTYWKRRIKFKDAVEAKPPKAAETKPKAKAPLKGDDK